ncbi:MAG: UbiA prenyltransferase family protein [Chloroflexota bacterium]
MASIAAGLSPVPLDQGETSVPVRPTFRGHIQIARIDHWFKNVFVLPGIIAAIGSDPAHVPARLWINVLVGLFATCFVASSNYVINEVLDARTDRFHPIKHTRPVPSGKVSVPLAYVQWIVLMLMGVGLGLVVSIPFSVTLFVLWCMGCIYNIPPIRTKDLPYIDVLSESINNPLRMLAGWFIASTASIAPASLLLSYWMVGCFFMATKRYAEYREIGDPARAAAYRKSLGHYSLDRLMVCIMFYASTAMLFLGAFIMRYRLELILAFPLVALVMAIYLSLSFKDNSPAQNPEGLYREPWLMVAVVACTVLMGVLLLVNIPIMQTMFAPTAPTILDRK